jgi:hypothetical protein
MIGAGEDIERLPYAGMIRYRQHPVIEFRGIVRCKECILSPIVEAPLASAAKLYDLPIQGKPAKYLLNRQTCCILYHS